MKQNRICKYCENEFIDIDGRIFSNHVRWCDKNTNYNAKSFSDKIKSKAEKLSEYTKTCKSCNTLFMLKCKPSKFDKSTEFCSRSCANRRIHSNETKEKMRVASKLYIKKIHKEPQLVDIKCKNCSINFLAKLSRNAKFCCVKCSIEHRRSQKDLSDPDNKRKTYHRSCMFRFSLNSFPKEFDFGLIEKFGWYKAKNHGDNLNGISRDHMISVSYGFENNIPCEIISHPANCMLMQHNDNVSKYKDCSISLEELNQRIIYWEIKYGKFVPLDWMKCRKK